MRVTGFCYILIWGTLYVPSVAENKRWIRNVEDEDKYCA